MKKKKHILLMIVTLALAVVCGMMMPYIHVNSDMTQYLPDDSRMKQGVDIIADNWGSSQLSTADIKIMFHDIDSTRRQTIADELALNKQVKGVTCQVSEDNAYTKFELLVAPNLDQRMLGTSLQKQYGQDVVVETSQDGATPPVSALIIAGVIILLILLIMAQSWMEPLLYLFAIGVAVILNIGTNALLPSVSITTNYIVAILQLVLSLDYAIVLSNRYRQELSPNCSITDSVNRAIRKAYPAIISSATTTVVGLIMLAFMRVKIGLDLGMVLAKGVICSLITTFTLLPALLLLCHRAIIASHKRTFIIPTDRLARFATNHKRSFAIAALALFGVAFYYSNKTNIYFSTNGESQIEKVFPKTNTIVAVYDTEDETAVLALADSLKKDTCVQAVISYPTMLKQPYTADNLVTYIYDMSAQMAEYMPPMDLAQLTPEIMRTVYFMRSQAQDTMRVTFPALLQFVKVYCLNNPLFDKVINDDVHQQMALLDAMMTVKNEPAEDTEDVPVPQPETPLPAATAQQSVDHPAAPVSDTLPVVTTIANALHRMYMEQQSDLMAELLRLTDSTALHQPLTVRQMAEYIGSTVAQTNMVYGFSKDGKQMTPLAYVHLLTDDLFQRPTVAKMVSEDEKNALIVRTRIMDAAAENRVLTTEQINDLLAPFGLSFATTEEEQPAPVIATVDTMPQPAAHSVTTVVAASTAPKAKSQSQQQAELFAELMEGQQAYTATEMAHHFTSLGQEIDSTTCSLLYCYYGSHYCYNDSLVMNPEQLLLYAADTLIRLDIVSTLLDSASIQMIDSIRTQLGQAVSMLRHTNYSLMILLCNLPDESEQTYAFIDRLNSLTETTLAHPCYLVGESVMFSELKNGFTREMAIITILTILSIFLIVSITFKSVIVPAILIITVMTAVYVNVIVSGLVSGEMLYLAYLIVQSILMGATIDYGILYANYYKENRRTMLKYEAAKEAYHGSIPTIMTSGLIMVLGPGVMSLLVDDVTISAIVGCIAVGAFMAILMILLVLPGVLVVCDKWVTAKKIRINEQK